MQSRQLTIVLLETAALIMAAATLELNSVAQSAPALVNYQGKLTDQTGAPLPAGSYGIQFRIWDDGTAAGPNDLIWYQQQNVTLQTNGVFNVILGSPGGSPIQGATPAVNNIAYAFSGPNSFLGVTVVVSNGTTISSPSEILPRQQLLSAPYALVALHGVPPGTLVPWAGLGSGLASVPQGWILANGQTIGNPSSGASFADPGARSLYRLLWNSFGNDVLPITNSSGAAGVRGASADADFNAGNSLPTPDLRGRTAIGAGQGTGLSMRTFGQNIGEEMHTLTEAEMPAHNHGGVTGTDYPDHAHLYGGYQFGASYGGDNITFNPTTGNNGAYGTGGATARHQHAIPTDGGGAAHNVMQPSISLTYLIKL